MACRETEEELLRWDTGLLVASRRCRSDVGESLFIVRCSDDVNRVRRG
jgi:hypothetical protein